MHRLESLIGQTLDDRYLLERLLGRGGMGGVFLGRHLWTGRAVAVKLIAPELISSPDAFTRFRREARAAGMLQHPNIVNVTDFGIARMDTEPLAYLVMEHLEGETLRALMARQRQLPTATVVEIVGQIAQALDAAHAQGIVHRDLKPENIWIERGSYGAPRIKILDFGLVKLREETPADSRSLAPGAETDLAGLASGAGTGDDPEAATVFRQTPPRHEPAITDGSGGTRAGDLLGTPAYMSPEQCRGKAIDFRSDIYSLGVVTWQMFAGDLPFRGDTPALIHKHVTEDPPPLAARRPDLPREAAELVMSTLEKLRTQRPRSAGQFASALRVYCEPAGSLLRHAFVLAFDRIDDVWPLWGGTVLPWILPPVLLLALSGFRPLPGFGGASLGLLIVVLPALVIAWFDASLVFPIAVSEWRAGKDRSRSAPALRATAARRLGLSPESGRLRLLLRATAYFTRATLLGSVRENAADLKLIATLLDGSVPASLESSQRRLRRSLRPIAWIEMIGTCLLGVGLPLIFFLGSVVKIGDRPLIPQLEAFFTGPWVAVLLIALTTIASLVLPISWIARTLWYLNARWISDAESAGVTAAPEVDDLREPSRSEVRIEG